MEDKELFVVDIETDGFYSTKIHVMSIGSPKTGKIYSTSDSEIMKKFLTDRNHIIIGHNFKAFDAVELERVLDFKIEAEIWDTLSLAWYIYPFRVLSYGLEAFGAEYGIEKPEIDDWENLTYKEYEFRCEEDVKINLRLWRILWDRILNLYDTKKEACKLIRYLMFKTDCLVHQKQIKCRIDVERVYDNIKTLEPLSLEKQEALKKVMPPGTVKRSKPKVMYKKDKSISTLGQKWFNDLRALGLPLDSEAIYNEPNPNSTPQIKSWLFSLGWEPILFNDGANGPVPQVRDENRELCSSVKSLVRKEPAIEALEGLTVITHRLNLLKGFLETANPEGYVVAGAQGFTNTLRLRHRKPIANLPKVTKKGDLRDGRLIRECIIAKDGHILCGSDISALEDQTKRHYLWTYDQEYVLDQMKEGYDPHLDLALRAGAITEDQIEQHKLYAKTGGKEGEDFSETRDIYKRANYSCIYGVGIPGLSALTGLPLKETRQLIKDYWDRNWAIKQLIKDVTVKIVDNQMWLYNPVSRYWYAIRNEKDIFSTLNQGTGSFIFDLWVNILISKGHIPFLQYHDEVLVNAVPDKKQEMIKDFKAAMEGVNTILNLNVKIDVDVQFGPTYADVH